MTASRREFLAGLPIAVDAARIESELARLWHPDEDTTGGGDVHGVTRACLANLICLAPPDDAEREMIESLLLDLGSRFPSRVIMLESADESERVEATVSAVCNRPRAGVPPVCCERISLRYGPRHARFLHGLVTPLLVPDLPAVLLLFGSSANAAGAELLSALGGVVERVVLDSRLRDGVSSAVELGRDPDLILEDLAWRSLIPWRRTLRDLFDEEEPRSILSRMRQIEIHCGPRPAEGSLLAGWLVSRLGWSWSDAASPGEGGAVEFRRGGEVLTLRLRRDETPRVHPIGVVGIEFCEGVDRSSPFVEVSLGPGGDVFLVKYCTSFTCVMPRTYSFRPPTDVDLLGDSLASTEDREVFRAALTAAQRIPAS